MKANDPSDDYCQLLGSAPDDREIRRLIEMIDQGVGSIQSDYGGDKSLEYFGRLVRKAALAAAERYRQTRDPIPPLVVSALRAGEPDSLACERASGGLIDNQTKLEQLIQKFTLLNDAVN